jgi:ubiquinol-cytochrome c reductase cytochrome b subunit
MSRLNRLKSAIDSRTGLVSLTRAFLGHRVHGMPSLSRALGATQLVLFLLACATGIALSLVYSPSVTSAWGSVAHLETRVPLGHLIRAIHHHTTSAILIVGALHLVHLVASAAYRRPREATWHLALFTFILLPAFAITGNLLPMDEDGVWGALVELEVIAAAPLGDGLKSLLLGGDTVSNATLTRFTTLHTIVLPAIFLALTTIQFIASRRREPAPSEPSSPFFPAQAARNTLVASLAVVCTIVIASTLGARLDAPFDPSVDYEAHPEWYFLALNQLNALGGTTLAILAPALALLFLIALPLLDRRPSGRPSALVAIPFTLIVLGALGLTAIGLLKPRDAEAERLIAERANLALTTFETDGLDPAGRLRDLSALALYRDKGCASCHDNPEFAAPRLAGWASVERTSAFLENPDAPRFFANSPFVDLMPPFEGSPEERTLLSRWLLNDTTLTTSERTSAHKLFLNEGCTDCHNDPTTPLRDKAYDLRATGPDLTGYANREWTRAVIIDANHPALFGDAISEKDLPRLMPAYPDLTDDDLSLLVEWLLRGAPRAR